MWGQLWLRLRRQCFHNYNCSIKLTHGECCLRHPRPYRIWTGYLKTNMVFCCCFYCRSYTVLLSAYCHRSIPNWWNCRPPIHSCLYSLVQSPPKCKVLFWITNSSMPAIIWDWISWSIHASVKDRQCLCCSQLALWS